VNKLLAISWREQVAFRLDDDDVRSVPDQRAEFYFYSTIFPKQQCTGIHFTPLGHITPIPSQLVFALYP